MTVRAEVSKHERDGWPFDTSARTEFWMQMAETMIMAGPAQPIGAGTAVRLRAEYTINTPTKPLHSAAI